MSGEQIIERRGGRGPPARDGGDDGSGSAPKRRRIGDAAEVEMEEAAENDDLVELHLRVQQEEGDEKIEMVRVRPDAVDLSVCTRAWWCCPGSCGSARGGCGC